MLVCDNDARHIANDYSPNKFYPSPYTHTHCRFFRHCLSMNSYKHFTYPICFGNKVLKCRDRIQKSLFVWIVSFVCVALFVLSLVFLCILMKIAFRSEILITFSITRTVIHSGCLTWSHVHSGGIQCTSEIPLNFSSERNFYVCMCVWQSFFCTTEHMPARHLPICYFSTCTPSHSVLVLSLRRWRIHFVCIFRESYSRVWHIFKFSAWCFCLYRVFFAHVSLSCCIFLIFERAHSIARPSSRDTTE